MKSSKAENTDKEFEPLIKLIQVMRDEPVINERVLTILKLDSFQRRIVINNWLEQLHRQNASENLRQAFSCLFDDGIAEKVIKIINSRQILKKG